MFRSHLLIFCLIASEVLSAASILAKPPKFEPISEEEIAMSEPQLESEAEIEFLYRSRITRDRDVGATRVNEFYNRLKVFKESGIKQLDVINLFYEKGESEIRDFAARVTNPDGSVFELDKTDLFDRKVFDSRDIESHAKSFSFPHLQVGSIVEYAWDEVVDGGRLWSLRMKLLSDWPTHEYRVEVFPYERYARSMRGYNYDLEYEKTKDRSYLYIARDLESNEEEPYSPPYYSSKPWIFLQYYGDNNMIEADNYWANVSENLYDLGKETIKPKQGAVKQLAKELFEGTNDAEEKLRRAYRYVSEEVKNIYTARSGFTDEERARLKDVDSPGETIKRGYGTGFDVNSLFATLAEAAGFTARHVRCEDRLRIAYSPNILEYRITLPERVIALRLTKDDPWRFFDPGYDYLPFGLLDADCMSAVAVVGNKDEFEFTRTPIVPASFSVAKRVARFELSEWGDLKGNVTVEYSGYTGIWRKRRYDEMSETKREESYCEGVKEQFPGCSIENFKMENIFTRDEPLVVSYDIEVPHYAESLGRRIFFQPNFFRFDEKPMFESDTRDSLIMFSYPWTEDDEVWVSFPEGYKLEEAASPGLPIDAGPINYSCTYALNKSRSKMRCKRVQVIDTLGLEVESYEVVKRIFDTAQKYDTHVLTLSRTGEES